MNFTDGFWFWIGKVFAEILFGIGMVLFVAVMIPVVVGIMNWLSKRKGKGTTNE